MPDHVIGFLGAGNMAGGIARGLLRAQLFAPEQLLASEPDADRRARFAESFEVQTVADNREVADRCDILLIAVKPQVYPQVLNQIQSRLTPTHLLISIMAGVRTRSIEERTGLAEPRVVRVMPNLALNVGLGMTCGVRGRFTHDADMATARRLFEASGAFLELGDEALMDAVTAIAGSGPAYVYLLAEAMVRAGVEAGFSADHAAALTKQTLLGASTMLIESSETPVELRERVTSPGGTTAAALAVLRDRGFVDAVRAAVQAAIERGRELGR